MRHHEELQAEQLAPRAPPTPPLEPVVIHEVTAYMATPALPMTTDVLKWWAKLGRNLYPNLARLARQFLGCPASSASAERIFSLAGRVFNDHTQNLTPQNLEERMWAKCNRGKIDQLVKP